MAAKRVAIKAVDWAKLGAAIPKAAVADFNAFRARHETIKGSLSALPEKPVPIDWSYYTSNIKDNTLVKSFQAAYSKVSVPYPEDTESSKIAEEEKAIEIEIQEASKQQALMVADLQAKLDAIRNEKPIEEVTTEEYVKLHPEIEEEVNRDMKRIGLQ